MIFGNRAARCADLFFVLSKEIAGLWRRKRRSVRASSFADTVNGDSRGTLGHTLIEELRRAKASVFEFEQRQRNHKSREDVSRDIERRYNSGG
jgi:hypothetical protein